jgi:hypothetical protein
MGHLEPGCIEELLDQPRLPDPRLAFDHDERGWIGSHPDE